MAAGAQASPYVWTMALVPMHFLTHELLLFATAVCASFPTASTAPLSTQALQQYLACASASASAVHHPLLSNLPSPPVAPAPHTHRPVVLQVWTTNIHDCVYGGGEPIMGAGYHLIHHTGYKYNYGHYLTVCDWMFGTLKRPPTYGKPVDAKAH